VAGDEELQGGMILRGLKTGEHGDPALPVTPSTPLRAAE
jgi:hypothetical protein